MGIQKRLHQPHLPLPLFATFKRGVFPRCLDAEEMWLLSCFNYHGFTYYLFCKQHIQNFTPHHCFYIFSLVFNVIALFILSLISDESLLSNEALRLRSDGVADGVMHFARKREATMYFIDMRQ